MLDCRIFDYIAAQAAGFDIRHNAHLETDTTIARHLLHRERIGEKILFAGHEGRANCIEGKSLWEMSIRPKNGDDIHIAGPSLDLCLQIAKASLEQRAMRAIAA